MRNLYKILIIAGILISIIPESYSQAVTVPADTTTVSKQQTGTQERTQEKKQQGNTQNQQGNINNSKGKGDVKQVRGARPDWSKSKSARPNITRPSGSTVPKGVGKPGGAGFHGGR
jgi:hypothetical protein